ncbi:hypothetical protein BBOV_II007690 [Babesia bovis T2Bo]|uniref:Uncharacterized protein n=1 Tax=Babesia bovis TaxID=5865 RepID=A7AUV8_BABBO|nr:hypothetical protein BBOV_II007690 [Babesia bovis T2Bo]EDO06719.1 hypothetical protein BBOV_II007690 [Babesia bovis T2Bo]|eukprot:XP_001610287.1 hypothetical protein [Babesia bovis T2Bo]
MSTSEGIVDERESSETEPCHETKATYQKCFNAWIRNDFLKGNMEDKCRPQLLEYRACIKQYFTNRKEVEVLKCIEQYEKQ